MGQSALLFLSLRSELFYYGPELNLALVQELYLRRHRAGNTPPVHPSSLSWSLARRAWSDPAPGIQDRMRPRLFDHRNFDHVLDKRAEDLVSKFRSSLIKGVFEMLVKHNGLPGHPFRHPRRGLMPAPPGIRQSSATPSFTPY